jgi:hypothetical protein
VPIVAAAAGMLVLEPDMIVGFCRGSKKKSDNSMYHHRTIHRRDMIMVSHHILAATVQAQNRADNATPQLEMMIYLGKAGSSHD